MSSHMSTTQKAQVFQSNGGPIKLETIPLPVPKADEVLVHLKYTGVCHTDLHAWQGDWPIVTKKPLVGGHEGVGEIVGLGSGVHNYHLGDKVGIKWINGTCGTCTYCMHGGIEQLCPQAELSGYTVNGTFQQYATVQASQATRIPDHVKLAEIAPVMCAGVTVYTALKRTEAKPGQTIAITGAGGGLGSFALQYAKCLGLRVIAIDTGKEKEQACRAAGAEAFVDYMTTKDLIQDVKNHSPDGFGPHGALIVAAAEKPMQQATEYVRSDGVVVCVGLPGHGALIKADVFQTVARMVTIRGSYVGSMLDAQEAVDFFARGLIKCPTQIKKLEDLPSVYDDMKAARITGRIVLDLQK
ncbi:putative alcohol dehydrogenase 1 [Ascobolus immersus RN42]|uniref:alcohol dehydrogenase n=1 Tax=Ascobolus immersus RN42 TaxID=1160509 RepID=A0A3N4IR22_ASCIM|nr:putative alcohol dehydrogenase 1 [Ascobolus immersus RN42]